MINDACFNSEVPYFKYVDDLTLVESRTLSQPSKLQNTLSDFYQWSLRNNMTLNPSKCHCMFISFSKNIADQRPLFIGDECLNSVQKAKILGITVQSDLKWDSHISDLLCRANKKLFMLRILKTYRLPFCDVVTIYKGYIRPILDYGVPVFNGNLTQSHILSLERIQKRACRTILGDQYINYDKALEVCSLQTSCQIDANNCALILLHLLSTTHFVNIGYLLTIM